MTLLLRGVGLWWERRGKENGQGRHQVIRDGLQNADPLSEARTSLRRQKPGCTGLLTVRSGQVAGQASKTYVFVPVIYA